MSDAYYPADDIELLTATGQYRDRHGAAWRETFAYKRDQERALAPLVPDTRRARYAVLANHCAQARAGYFYCGQTPADPCGYSAENRHPHSECTAGECKAPHTCGDLAAYGQATSTAGRWVLCTTHSVKFPAGGEQAHKADTFGDYAVDHGHADNEAYQSGGYTGWLDSNAELPEVTWCPVHQENVNRYSHDWTGH